MVGRGFSIEKGLSGINELILCRARKKLEFQLALWTSGSQICLPWASLRLRFLRLADDLPGPLPIGQVRMKSDLPNRKIYLSWTTGRHFFRALLWKNPMIESLTIVTEGTNTSKVQCKTKQYWFPTPRTLNMLSVVLQVNNFTAAIINVISGLSSCIALNTLLFSYTQ